MTTIDNGIPGKLNMWQSAKMREVQNKFGQPLPKLLVELQNLHGAARTCELLGISKASLGYWNLKCGIRVVRIAYIPGKETIDINDSIGQTTEVAS